MTDPFGVNRKSRRQLGEGVYLFLSLFFIVLVSDRLHAQVSSMGSKKPANAANPTALPPVIDLRQPPHDGWAVTAPATVKFNASPTPTPKNGKRIQSEQKTVPCPEGRQKNQWWEHWDLTLSILYQFSNQRSRVNDLSWNSNSAGIDLAAVLDCRPYTSVDFAYLYSHFTGSSPAGANDVTNQHIGAIRILQPLDPIWCQNWKPADHSASPLNQQWAALVRVAYGGSLGSLATPNFVFQHDTAHTFVGDALLDYQLAWFPHRQDGWDSCASDNSPLDQCSPAYRYPNFVCELSSGVQFSTLQFDASASRSTTTTSGNQLDYLNTVSLAYSFPCRWGILVAVAWDAPVNSQPLRGVKPYYANTATFTGGLVYNLFPGYSNLLDHVSVNLFYSYTAFDPFSETNTVQFQISYAF